MQFYCDEFHSHHREQVKTSFYFQEIICLTLYINYCVKFLLLAYFNKNINIQITNIITINS